MVDTKEEVAGGRLDASPQTERLLLRSTRAAAHAAARPAAMPAVVSAARCPGAGRPCPEGPDRDAALPPHGAGRTAILVLRFIAAARDTGDACCWDAALDHAEAAFGERRGPVVVARAGALIRRLARAGAAIAFLPPPCRRLSSGEALLLGSLGGDVPSTVLVEGPAAAEVAALARSITPAEAVRPRAA